MMVLGLVILAYLQLVLWFEWLIRLIDRSEALRADWHDTVTNALARVRRQLGMQRCDHCGRFVPEAFIEVILAGGIFNDKRTPPIWRDTEASVIACKHCLYDEEYP